LPTPAAQGGASGLCPACGLRLNGFYIDVTAVEGHEFIVGSMEGQEFRFPLILDWIHEPRKPL